MTPPASFVADVESDGRINHSLMIANHAQLCSLSANLVWNFGKRFFLQLSDAPH
jgi:hypothetical protein